MNKYQSLDGYQACDMNYACQFRSPNTEQGSFRTFSHGWCGDTAVMAAAQRLFDDEEVNEVEIHLCDHSSKGNQTVGVIRMWVCASSQWRTDDWYIAYTSNVSACESKLSEYNPTHFACKLAIHLEIMKSSLGENLNAYLQPTPEQWQELKEVDSGICS